jgi:hypothetical protein
LTLDIGEATKSGLLPVVPAATALPAETPKNSNFLQFKNGQPQYIGFSVITLFKISRKIQSSLFGSYYHGSNILTVACQAKKRLIVKGD